ncbi:uncharacterized protein METZ01_LOCUS500352 [marine metagenome]|uniref:DUF4956 domain-containing protein n=1 Tax=marine metagenome TaxID=408172 RepID=A0A383DUI4_9ZZZZ
MEYLLENLDKVYSIGLLLLSGFLVRTSLLTFGQTWVSSYSQFATFLLLPVITYVITSVISGNIALSLGMIGALSIVRFRNPVKSPFELVTFFLLITLGISASVAIKWTIFLTFTSLIIFLLLYLGNYFSLTLFNKPLYGISFNEGNTMSTLEIEVDSKKINLMGEPNLVGFSTSGSSTIYRFASNNRNDIKEMANKLSDNEEVKRLDLNLV